MNIALTSVGVAESLHPATVRADWKLEYIYTRGKRCLFSWLPSQASNTASGVTSAWPLADMSALTARRPSAGVGKLTRSVPSTAAVRRCVSCHVMAKRSPSVVPSTEDSTFSLRSGAKREWVRSPVTVPRQRHVLVYHKGHAHCRA